MSRIAYVNGRYVPHRAALVHVEDRGYQFADGVYEVIAVCRGRIVDEEEHLDRLERSLSELAMTMPMSRAALKAVTHETLDRNRVRDGLLYLQVTRGVAPRNHAFPRSARSALVMTARHLSWPDAAETPKGVRVISAPDERWKRPDIKSVSLLPNVMAKQRAIESGAYETWFVDDQGRVTEGSSTNAWIVDGSGQVVTREWGHHILGGITRARLLALARDAGVPVAERAFDIGEAKSAREAFITSTSSLVCPVVEIDDVVIGDGRPGPVTLGLRALYLEYFTGGRANA